MASTPGVRTPSRSRSMTEAEPGEVLILVLSHGCAAGDLAAIIEGLRSDSTKISSHSRREFFWNGYSSLSQTAAALDGGKSWFLLYKATGDGGGEAEAIELTKRQRGMVGGSGMEVMGRKLKPPDAEPDTKAWAMAWGEDEAAVAWDDIMGGEPCIYLTNDAVYVATRYKRVHCKSIKGLKTVKDIEAAVSVLKPGNPLRSISFVGDDAPVVNSYNTFVTGALPTVKELPPAIGHVNASSTALIYDYFMERKNDSLVADAGKLITQMLIDVAKNREPPLVSCASKKEAATAYKNALMKKAYVHESMAKFAARAKSDGMVEVHVIKGDLADLGDFGSYGGIVFELFYRVDLSTF